MFYVFKDNVLKASTHNRDAAIDLIRAHQCEETHYMLRAEFSIIEGKQEFIAYDKSNKRKIWSVNKTR